MCTEGEKRTLSSLDNAKDKYTANLFKAQELRSIWFIAPKAWPRVSIKYGYYFTSKFIQYNNRSSKFIYIGSTQRFAVSV